MGRPFWVARGSIDIVVAGEHAARLSREEAAELAEELWRLGSATKRRGAIAVAAALKMAAHNSELAPKVDVRQGDVGAVQHALSGMPTSDDDDHGLDDLAKALA